MAQKPGDEAALALQDLVDTLNKHNVDQIKKSVILPNVVMTADNFGQTAQYQYPAS